MKLKVDVTENDIKYGVKGDCQRCMVARALIRTLKQNKIKKSYVSVGSIGILFVDDLQRRLYGNLPKNVTKKIEIFDEKPKKESKPFSFTINLNV